MTRICIPLMAPTGEALARAIDAARSAGTDMIELRLDFLEHWTPEDIDGLMLKARQFPGQVIATCRLKAEGGRYEGDEAPRIRLLERAALGGADYIDVEYAAWRAHSGWRDSPVLGHGRVPGSDQPPAEHRARLILSKHDFARTPDDLDAIFTELMQSPADVLKLACMVESVVDSIRMLDALRTIRRRLADENAGREAIALSMGETGILTRVLARKFGALLTFAAIDAGRESAPGQPTVTDFRDLYRWNAITPATKVYGVIGCPVGHSMSPAIHNAAFGAVGHDGVYLPVRIEPPYEAFAAFLDACLNRPWLDLHGLSVTIPHKENLLRYVREHGGEIEPLTARIGVANTLVIEPCGTGVSPVELHRRNTGATQEENTGGTSAPHRPHAGYRLYAFNTDYRGALDALCEGMGCQPADLAGLPVAVLGAGGVSRAIVAGLVDSGCRVTIYNRTAEKAAALAVEFGAEALPWNQRVHPDTRVIINCTSIGMWPNIADTPLAETGIPRAMRAPSASEGDTTPPPIVFDTVYNPIETRLLREAREHGHKTIDGVAMFVGQAAAQFKRWTARPAPTELMREVVVSRLRRG